MSDKRLKIPQIRFDGFIDEWQEYRLGELSDIKTGPFGSTLHAEDYVEDGVPIITTEHFKSGKLPSEKENIPQVSTKDYARLQSYVLNIDDIVFSRVGSVDINALVLEAQQYWLFSGRVLRVRSNETVDSQYLHYELSTSRVKNHIIARAVGQTMPSINTEILKETEILLPNNINEQQKNGIFFEQIDNIIAFYQHEYELLSEAKQSYLQEMFPKEGEKIPNLRFEGFVDEWEEVKLGNIVDKQIKGKAQLSKLNIGDVEYLDASRLNGGEVLLTDGVKDVEEDDILILWDGSKAGTVYTGFAGALGSTFKAYRTSVDSSFVYQFLKFKQEVIYKNYRTPNIPHVQKDFLNIFQINVPTILEQKKIGAFFKSFDRIIDLKKFQLDQLMIIKKTLLQRMFI